MTTDPRIIAAAKALEARSENDDWEWCLADAIAALAAADAVDPLRRPGHRVEATDAVWTLQHPPECRPNLLACPLNDAIRESGGVADGVWAVEQHADGHLTFHAEVSQ